MVVPRHPVKGKSYLEEKKKEEDQKITGIYVRKDYCLPLTTVILGRGNAIGSFSSEHYDFLGTEQMFSWYERSPQNFRLAS